MPCSSVGSRSRPGRACGIAKLSEGSDSLDVSLIRLVDAAKLGDRNGSFNHL